MVSATGTKGLICTRAEQCEGRRGQKGWICTRDNITMARRGQKGWICTRESNDGGKMAEVIIKTDKVSDVGRIFNGVENGLKVLAKVKLIYYIDKGWVVEDCDI